MITRGPSWHWFALFDKPDDKPDDPPPGSGGAGGGRGDRESGLTALRARFNNDLERAVVALFDENYDLRDKNRKLREKADSARLPEGSVVLSKDDAALFDTYRKLGEPAQLAKKTDLDAAVAKLEALDTERLHHRAAGLLGWKPTVTHDLLQSRALVVEIKSETENGKAVERVYVRPRADEKAPLTLAEQYVTDKLADYLPSLKQTTGPRLPNQPAEGGTGGGSGGLADRFIADREKAGKARVNPITAARTAKTSTT
jgi:hypothetical protein